MNWPRRFPLFARIAAMWWLVLFIYPPSRPLLFYAPAWYGLVWSNSSWILPLRDVQFPAPLPLLVLLSLGHSLAAGWIVARVLPWFRAGRDIGSFIWWTFLVAWFAVATGSALNFLLNASWRPEPLAAIRTFATAIFFSLLPGPFEAFTLGVRATLIVWPLALTTVLCFRRSSVLAERASAGPSAAAH